MKETQLHIKRERDPRIDIAKGILIILVVLGHCFQLLGLDDNAHLDLLSHKFIYSFHMPAFMLISGYLFFLSNIKALHKVVISKIISIGIPFVSFSSLMYFLGRCKDVFLEDNPLNFVSIVVDFSDYLLTSKVVWFLASLFINSIVVAILSRCKVGYIGYIAIFIASFFIPADNAYIAPAYLFMFPYFLAGYYLKKYNVSLFSLVGKRTILFVLLCFSIIGLYLYNRDTYIYRTGMYVLTDTPLYSLYTCFLRFALGFSMSALFFTVVAYFVRYIRSTVIEKSLTQIGMITLGIYGFQQILVGAIIRIIAIFDIHIPASTISVLLHCVIILLISVLLVKVCYRSKSLSFLLFGKTIRISN